MKPLLLNDRIYKRINFDRRDLVLKFFKHYFMMWLIFSILTTLTTLGLELLEGNKITTTEYYGLRNLGVTFIIFSLLTSIAIYPFSFFPLTLLVNAFINSLIVRVIIYLFVSGASGICIFNRLYNYTNGYLIKSYELNMYTSIILFSVAGLIYGLLDYFLKNKEIFVTSLIKNIKCL
jgi:hypothetical protein